jgi:predicted phosphodiesterase
VKAGILSDSHDERGLAEDALGLFREEGVEVILHLGDVCRPETILALRDCGIPMIGVYGNNDYDKEGLQAVSGDAFHPGPHGKPTCAVIDLATMVASIREIRAGVAGTADLSGDAVMNPRKR